MRSARHILQALHLRSLTAFIPSIVEKSLNLLNENTTPYKIKIACCEILELIALQLNEETNNVICNYHDTVIQVLLNATRDKILFVQSSAKLALKSWNSFKRCIQGLELQKIHKQQQKLLQTSSDMDHLIDQRQDQNNFLPINNSQSEHKDNHNSLLKNHLLTSQVTASQRELSQKKASTNRDYLHISQKLPKKQMQSAEARPQQKQSFQLLNPSSQQQAKLTNFVFKQPQLQVAQSSVSPRLAMIESEYQDTIVGSSSKSEDFRENVKKGQFISPSVVEESNASASTLKIQLRPNTAVAAHQLYGSSSPSSRIQFRIQPDPDEVGHPNVIPPMRFSSDIEVFNENEGELDQLAETLDFQELVRATKHVMPPKQVLIKPTVNSQKQQSQPLQGIFRNSSTSLSANGKEEATSGMSELTAMWVGALELADSGNFEKAFSRVIESGDDIYLIRLLLRNRNGFKHLSRNSQAAVMKKIIILMESNFLSRLCLGFFQDSVDCGLVRHLPDTDQAQVFDILHEIAELKSEIAPQAAHLLPFYEGQINL